MLSLFRSLTTLAKFELKLYKDSLLFLASLVLVAFSAVKQ